MPGPARDPRYLHLVRLDTSKVAGWQLRLPLWHPLSVEREYTELFSDSKWDGRAGALKAARKRRDALFAQAKLPLRNGGHTTNEKSTTGLVGVVLTFDGRRKGMSAFTWVALWSEKKVQRKQRFAVLTHGFDEALRQAVELREEKTGLVFSPEQLAHAQALRKEVELYARTGKRRPRVAARPPRTRAAEPMKPRAAARRKRPVSRSSRPAGARGASAPASRPGRRTSPAARP